MELQEVRDLQFTVTSAARVTRGPRQEGPRGGEGGAERPRHHPQAVHQPHPPPRVGHLQGDPHLGSNVVIIIIIIIIITIIIISPEP